MKQKTAILLAGGLSTRMGSSKADLKIAGKTQTQRLLEILDPLVDQIIIMLAADQKIPEMDSKLKKRVTIGRDTRKEQGPLQGISDAIPLLLNSSDSIFLLTCDLPYLNQDWLLKLSRGLDGKTQGVCAVTDGNKNALLGCYKKRVFAHTKRKLDRGKRRPRAIWDGFNIKFIEPSKEQEIYYQDMNTPKEYQQAKGYHEDNLYQHPISPFRYP